MAWRPPPFRSYLFAHELLSNKTPDVALHFFKKSDTQRQYQSAPHLPDDVVQAQAMGAVRQHASSPSQELAADLDLEPASSAPLFPMGSMAPAAT